MTYHLTHSRARRRYGRRAPQQAMGGLFNFVDDMIGQIIGTGAGSIQDARAQVCAGDAESATAQMTAQIESLDRTWNPTGFYDQDQMTTVLTTTINFANAARDRVTTALNEVDIRDSDHASSAPIFDKAMDAMQAADDRSKVFVDALRKAQDSGTRAIDAPGLKLWVVDYMKAARDLSKAAFFIDCNRSTLERVSAFLNGLVDKAIEIIKQVVGIVLQVGEAAVHAALDLAGFVGTVIKFAPWLLLAGGGYYLYKSYRDR